MRLGRYEFRARLLPTAATALMLPLLIALGVWQLGRAEQKQALLQMYAQRAQAAPIVLDGSQRDLDAVRYHSVTASGHFDVKHQVLLDNRIHRGQAGYEVITPLRIAGGTVGVLVDRGWVPLGATRTRLPETPIPQGRVTVRGTIGAAPTTGLDLDSRFGPDTTWPVLLNIDIAWLETRLGYRLLPYVIRLDRQDPNGFVRDWRLFDIGPERHLGYAFQWLALAVTLAVIYITVNTRRTDAEEKGRS